MWENCVFVRAGAWANTVQLLLLAVLCCCCCCC